MTPGTRIIVRQIPNANNQKITFPFLDECDFPSETKTKNILKI